jgi:hypothetical protein
MFKPVRGFVLALAVLVLLATPALADPDPLDVPQGGGRPPIDAQTAGAAYGDLSVFILNVAAGNDGVPQQPEGEQAFKRLFGDPVVAAFPSLGAQDQQSLAQLAMLDTQLRQVWAAIPDDQRTALRDQWAESVQEMVGNSECELFDAMARAQLLPSFGQYKQTNINRLLDCWHQHPELTRDEQERQSAEGHASGGVAMGGGGSHSTFMSMLNSNMYRYTASMNIASMGTATYTVKRFP